jgi:hypothetical protein
MMTDIAQLERLYRLRECGGLSSEEYEREKARVLAGGSANRTVFMVGGMLAIALIIASVLIFGRQLSDGNSHPVAITTPTPKPASEPPGVPPGAVETAPVGAPNEPPMPKAAASNPTKGDTYSRAKRNVMRRYWDQPAGIRKKLGDWAGATALCRGATNVEIAEKWCPIRNALGEKLRALGMCYGRPTDRSAAESKWHTCNLQDR